LPPRQTRPPDRFAPERFARLNLLLEKAHIFGGKDKPASFVEAGKDKNDFLQCCSDLDSGRLKNGKKQKDNAKPLVQNTTGAHKTYSPKQRGVTTSFGIGAFSVSLRCVVKQYIGIV
jgi:hypothetical protein